MTECIGNRIRCQEHGSRNVEVDFEAGVISSDAGGLLLREVEHRFGFIEQFATCFTDHRNPDSIEHSVVDLLKQRIFGLCLGYEDLVDHDQLRHDPLLALICDKDDLTGANRKRSRDRGIPLAGKSTLNRLELTAVGVSSNEQYKKIVGNITAMQGMLVEAYLQQQPQPPDTIILDLDATDVPLHGDQLGRFFHGYYDQDCYLPLYIFCEDHLLSAVLHPADQDAARGCIPPVERIVTRLRQQWPGVQIILRGDSGFCREWLMKWCESQGIDFLFGLAKNRRLIAQIDLEMALVEWRHRFTGEPNRLFREFQYRTLSTWSRERRVVGKAEWLHRGGNPRFVVTSLTRQVVDAQTLYEECYCHRGEMENRIKEQQLYLFADTLSCETMRANQLRMLLSGVAYVLMRALREHGLKETGMSRAQAPTILRKLLKVAGWVRISVRRVRISFSQSYPDQSLWASVLSHLREEPGETPQEIPSG